MSGLSLSEFSKRYLKIMSDIMPKMMKTQTDALIKGKLSLPQFVVLFTLSQHGPQKMSFLAKQISVSLPAISGLVDRLHKLGMIRRIYEAKDRRVIKIDLSSKVKDLVQDTIQQRLKMISSIFSTIKPQEREAFLDILKKIHNFYQGKNV